MSSITLETVRSLLAEKGTEQTAHAKQIVAVAVEEYGEARKSGESATLSASLATYAAEKCGILPAKGQRTPGGTGGDMLSGKAYAEKFGVQGSTVTMWRTCGYAVNVLNVDPDETRADDQMTTWRLLAYKGAATNAKVSEAVYAENATVETVREAIAKVRDLTDGTVVGQKKSPNSETADEKRARLQKEKEKSDAALAEAIASDPVALILATVRDILVPACKGIAKDDTAGWTKVQKAMSDLLAKENTIRTPVPKAPRTRKAAPKAA